MILLQKKRRVNGWKQEGGESVGEKNRPVQTSSYYSRNWMPSVTYINIHTFILSLCCGSSILTSSRSHFSLSFCCGKPWMLRFACVVMCPSWCFNLIWGSFLHNSMISLSFSLCHFLPHTPDNFGWCPRALCEHTPFTPPAFYESCSNAVTLRAVTLAPAANTFICYQPSAHIYTNSITIHCVF